MTPNTPATVGNPAAELLSKASLLEDVLYDAWDDARHHDEDRASDIFDLYLLAQQYRVDAQKRTT
ncbi:hypothetical protein [Streptomyces niveus]|uniref:hypothetical protein n=1 Tax=Streptomyces niveus TaxID=193462 RepID=UPI003870D130